MKQAIDRVVDELRYWNYRLDVAVQRRVIAPVFDRVLVPLARSERLRKAAARDAQRRARYERRRLGLD